MIKKIKPENVLKIAAIQTEDYIRCDYVPDSATIIYAVLKLPESCQRLPPIDEILEKADKIIGSPDPDEMKQFINKDWISAQLIVKYI